MVVMGEMMRQYAVALRDLQSESEFKARPYFEKLDIDDEKWRVNGLCLAWA